MVILPKHLRNLFSKTNKKFYNRFHYIENVAKSKKQNIEDLSLKELLNYWERAKNEEKEN